MAHTPLTSNSRILSRLNHQLTSVRRRYLVEEVTEELQQVVVVLGQTTDDVTHHHGAVVGSLGNDAVHDLRHNNSTTLQIRDSALHDSDSALQDSDSALQDSDSALQDNAYRTVTARYRTAHYRSETARYRTATVRYRMHFKLVLHTCIRVKVLKCKYNRIVTKIYHTNVQLALFNRCLHTHSCQLQLLTKFTGSLAKSVNSMM